MQLATLHWQSTPALLMYLGPFMPNRALFRAKEQKVLETEWMLFYQMWEYAFIFASFVHYYESFQIGNLLIAIRFIRLSLFSFSIYFSIVWNHQRTWIVL